MSRTLEGRRRARRGSFIRRKGEDAVQAGDLVDGFRVLRPIGESAMAQLLLAEPVDVPGDYRVLKLLHAHLAAIREHHARGEPDPVCVERRAPARHARCDRGDHPRPQAQAARREAALDRVERCAAHVLHHEVGPTAPPTRTSPLGATASAIGGASSDA